MAAPDASRLDANQVLQGSFDEATGRLRTDAVATIVNADIDVQMDPADDGIHIGDKTNGNTAAVDSARNLAVKDQAVVDKLTDVNTELDAQTVILGNIETAISGPQSLPSGAATEAKQDIGNASLTSLDSKLPAKIAGRVPVDALITNQISGFATEATLLNIETALNNPLQIIEPIKTAGTIDGTLSGTTYLNVNNIRQQILATHDREQDVTYADFGTKNQRITQVDYNSVTFPGTIARKTIVYTLVSGRYRRDSINWSII